MAAKYNLDFIYKDVFPTFWQTFVNNAFSGVLLNGCFENVNDSSVLKEIEYTDKIGYSIERLSLEIALNKEFDLTLGRIVVENGVAVNNEFVFNETETIPTELNLYVYNESESIPDGGAESYVYNNSESISGSSTGFTVYVPIEYVSLENLIIKWIDAVKIYGTYYQIIYI